MGMVEDPNEESTIWNLCFLSTTTSLDHLSCSLLQKPFSSAMYKSISGRPSMKSTFLVSSDVEEWEYADPKNKWQFRSLVDNLGNAHFISFFVTGSWDHIKLLQSLKAYQKAMSGVKRPYPFSPEYPPVPSFRCKKCFVAPVFTSFSNKFSVAIKREVISKTKALNGDLLRLAPPAAALPHLGEVNWCSVTDSAPQSLQLFDYVPSWVAAAEHTPPSGLSISVQQPILGFIQFANVNKYLENYERALTGFEAAALMDPGLNAMEDARMIVLLLDKLDYLLRIKEGGQVTLLEPFYHFVDFSWKGKVELSCSQGTIDINHVVSFYRLSLATILMKNNGRDPVKLTLAILSHLMSKTRGGTGIQGLQSCTYCRHPPLSSVFDILSPEEAKKTEEPGIFSFGWASEKKPGIWSTQNVFITVLKHKLHVLRLAEEHKVVCNLTSPTQGLTSLTDRCQII